MIFQIRQIHLSIFGLFLKTPFSKNLYKKNPVK